MSLFPSLSVVLEEIKLKSEDAAATTVGYVSPKIYELNFVDLIPKYQIFYVYPMDNVRTLHDILFGVLSAFLFFDFLFIQRVTNKLLQYML